MDYDVIIVGGGAAGLSAGQYSARAGRKTAVLESFAPGGQCMYIDKIENYPGFDEPVTGFELAQKFQQQAENFGVEVLYENLVKIEKDGDIFNLTTETDTHRAKAVIWASGAKHRHLGAPGEEQYAGKGVSYCGTCDGPFFRNKRIVVIGGGDTALTDALYLRKLSDDVTLIHRKKTFRAQANLIKRVEDSGIKTIMESTVASINGDGKKVTDITIDTNGVQSKIECDGVFVFVGMLPQTELLDKALLDRSGYVVTNERMETSLKGLFAAGDVRNTPFRQVVTAAADGAVAAHIASEYIDELDGTQYR